jgi:hypothetical protein
MRAEVAEAAPTMSRRAVASWLVGSERVSRRFTIIIPTLHPITNVSNTKTMATLMKDVKP